MPTTPDVCPNGCDLQGNSIPQEHIELGYYEEGATHFSRAVGYYSWELDRTVSWGCPDCGTTWPRWESDVPDEGKFLPGLKDLFERPSPFED